MNYKIDEILYQHCGDCQKSNPCKYCIEAKQAITELTLKQVMELIGEEEDERRIIGAISRNQLRAELRQSAERMYGKENR